MSWLNPLSNRAPKTTRNDIEPMTAAEQTSGKRRWPSWRGIYPWLGGLLIVAFLILGWVYLDRAINNKLSQMDEVLFQLLLVVLSVGGSALLAFYSGRWQAQREARGAFRHVKAHYEQLQSISAHTVELREGVLREASRHEQRHVPGDGAAMSLQTVQWLVDQQIAMAEVAVANWRDLLPDESAKLEQMIAAERAFRAQPRELSEDEIEVLQAEHDGRHLEESPDSLGQMTRRLD